MQNAVIIWTKVTPKDSIPVIEVEYEIATDKAFENIISNGSATTNPEQGYTVKIDVKSLQPASVYYYRFKSLDTYSITGKTKTAPDNGSESLNLAIVSCSNYEFGPFNGYGAIADRDDIDVVLHLGDYIYEYGARGYGDTTTGRFHMPLMKFLL